MSLSSYFKSGCHWGEFEGETGNLEKCFEWRDRYETGR